MAQSEVVRREALMQVATMERTQGAAVQRPAAVAAGAPQGIELRHLRYFVALADAGSFTHAAERIFVAQPTLSQQIRRLEEIVGAPLLQRRREGLRLTGAGRVLLDASRTVLCLVEHEVSRTRQAAGLGRPRLRVVMPPGLPESLAVPAAAGLRSAAAVANVDVAWTETALDAEFSLIQQRRADAGLGWLTAGPDALPAPLDAMAMGEFEPDVWVPSAHPAARRGAISLEELAGLQVIHGPRQAQPGTYDAWTTIVQAVDPHFGFTDPPFRRSLPITLAFAATGDEPTAVLTGPVTPAGGARPIRRSGPADACGMVRVSLQQRPLTALAALVWNGDLPRPLQQMLFDTADSLAPPASAQPAGLASLPLIPGLERNQSCSNRRRPGWWPPGQRYGGSTMAVSEPRPERPDHPERPRLAAAGQADPAVPGRRRSRLRYLIGILGPGLVTGAADDDPSGIATYSQTGAQFGYGQLWTAVWMYPLMTAVQEACGRIGNVTGKGLARNIKDHYSLRTLRVLVILLAAANLINIGADIGALGAAAALIIHVPVAVLMIGFTAVILTLEIMVSYRRYARVLKWLTVSLLAYPITAFLVPEPWGEIFRATFIPHIEFTAAFFYVITAVIGTTITPYMFFWQASQEVEEDRTARRSLTDLRTDNAVGMFFSQAVCWFIIVTAATVLHTAHVTTISTAADAAKALEPLVKTFPHSGQIAQGLFALGIVSLGMLAIPVMAGSTSYALAEARGKPEGLDLKPRQGRYFYGIIAASMVIGLCLNFIGVNPIQALVFAAVFNGIIAVPLIWFIDRIAANPDTMGTTRSGRLSRTLLAVTFLGMAAAVLAMALSYLHA